MTKSINEQISALADDELPPNELPLLLRRLERDTALSERLGRYYCIRESAQAGLTDAADGRFAAAIAAALAQEPALSGGRPLRKPNGWLTWLAGPAAGAAIAASVAVVAVAVWPTDNAPQTPVGTKSLATAGAPASERDTSDLARTVAVDEGGESTKARRVHWRQLDPQVQRRLNGYLVNHSENATTAIGPGGVLNYVRIAGHGRSQ